MDNRRPVRLYNTLSRRLEELPPPPGPVRMYVCGSTVYKRVHVGNARPYVLGLWLKRWLERGGYDVTLVHNITDVDDHIYEEAAKQGVPSRELAERATRWFLEDTDDLGLGRPDVEPKASDTIPEIISLVQELIERDFAYQANGDVYFRVARYPQYGDLSGAKLEEMVAQEPSDLKQDQRDFALWKGQKPREDFGWDSPWGRGRPGWHIECTAMAKKYLGSVFELHGGGNDLRFPHHENELAQARAVGLPFAKVWMHNGMLELDAEKMSKSLGNVVTLRNVLHTFGRETLLLYLLTGHWSKPLDFSEVTVEQAAAQAESFRNAFRVEPGTAPEDDWARFASALDDDFNTPEALAVLHDWRSSRAQGLLVRGLDVFGLASLAEGTGAPSEVRELAERRLQARRRRDFDEADRLREEIEALGWEARDQADGFVLVPRP
jgi:cysteinyl-tRNA synthetase